MWLMRIITRWQYKRLHNKLYGKRYDGEERIIRAFKSCRIYYDELEIYGLPGEGNRLVLQYWSESRYSIYVNKRGFIYDIKRG